MPQQSTHDLPANIGRGEAQQAAGDEKAQVRMEREPGQRQRLDADETHERAGTQRGEHEWNAGRDREWLPRGGMPDDIGGR